MSVEPVEPTNERLRRHQGRRSSADAGGRSDHEEARRVLLDLRRLDRRSWSLLAIIANLLPLPNPDLRELQRPSNGGPSCDHLLGTDDLGRDILSRLIYGCPGLAGRRLRRCAIGLIIGGIPAMISAYRRGRVDTVLNTGSLRRPGLPGPRGGHRHRVLLGARRCGRSRSSSASSARRSSSGWSGPRPCRSPPATS